MDASDNAAVRVITRLGLDYSQAITSTRSLAKAVGTLDASLRELKKTARGVGPMLASAFRQGERGLVAAAQQTQVGKEMGEKTRRDYRAALLKLERDLQESIARSQRLGVGSDRMTQMLAETRALQQITGELSKEQAKRVRELEKAARLAHLEIEATERGVRAERERIGATRSVANAAARISVAQEQANFAASKATIELAKQVTATERLAHQHGFLNAQANIQNRTFQQQLKHMNQHLKPLLEKVRAGKMLNEQDIARLNALRMENQLLQESAKHEEQIARLEAQRVQQVQEVERATQRRQIAAVQEQRNAEVALKSLQAQVYQIQQKIKHHGVANKVAGQEGLTLQAQLNTLRQQVLETQRLWNANRRLTPELQNQLALLQHQAKMLDLNVIAHSKAIGEIESMARRRLSWFFTGSLLFGSMTAVRRAISEIGEVEAAMVHIRRVMEDPLFDVDEMRQQLFQLGKDFGFTFDVVAEIALRWAQAGMGMRDALDATRASLLGLNTAEMDVEAATTSLIGIMATWGFQASQLEEVIDRLNITSDRFPLTTQDLIDALLRAGGTARAAGIEFNEMLGIITAMREASGRAGREIGNALNTIIAFSQRNIFIDTAQELGIPVFVDAVTKELRPMIDIFTDVAENWHRLSEETKDRLVEQAEATDLFSEEIAAAGGALEEWTDLQRRDLIAAAAQDRRRAFLLALMENFSRVQDVINLQERAIGHSMRQNEMTMETYQKKVAQLDIAWTEFVHTLASEGGGLDSLKGMVDAMQSGLSWFTSLSRQTQRAVIMFAQFAAVLGAVNLAIRALTGTGIITGVRTLMTYLGVLGSSLAGVGTFLLGPWGTAIAGAMIGLTYLTSSLRRSSAETYNMQEAFREARREFDAQIKVLEAQAKIHTDNINTLAELANEYRELNAVLAEVDQQDELRAEGARARQMQITMQITNLLGEETAARLENAKFSEQAVNAVIDAERDKASEIWASVDNIMDAKRAELTAQIEHTIMVVNLIKDQEEGWRSYLTVLENFALGYLRVMDTISLSANNALVSISRWISRQARALVEWHENLPLLPGGKHLLIHGLARFLAGEAERTAEHFEKLRQDILRQRDSRDDLFSGRALDRQSEALRELVDEWDRLVQTQREARERSKGVYEDYEEQEKKARSLADAIRSLVEAIVDEVDAVARLGSSTQREINLLEARIQHMSREGAALRELAQADQDRAKMVDLLRQRQGELHQEAQAGRKAIESLEQAQKRLNVSSEEGAKAFREMQSTIDRLRDRVGSLSVEWWRVESQIVSLSETTYQASREFEQAMESIARQAQLGILSVAEQARLAQQAVSDLTRLTVREQERFISDQASRYRQLLQDELRAIEDAYRKRLDAVTEWVDGEIEARQRLIEQLNEEQELDNREEAERQHLQTLEDLQEQRRYHELRTGREHREAILEIDRRIAEEQIRWERQVDQWRRRDRQEELRDEIEDIRRQGERRRDELQRNFEAIRADFSEHNIAMIAAAAALDPQWFERGRAIAENLIDGFLSGDFSGVVIGELGSLAGSASSTAKSAANRTDSRRERDVALLQAKREWEAAHARGDEAGMKAAAAKADKIRASGPTSDPNNTLTGDQLARIIGMQHGAFVKAGQNVLGLIGEGMSHEVVLPVHKAAPFFRETMRLALADTLRSPVLNIESGLVRALQPVEHRLAQILQALQSGAVATKIDRLVNVEEMHVTDNVDLDIFSRQFARRIRVIPVR